MYQVYAVRNTPQGKDRRFLCSEVDETEARRAAGVACLWADYAYVKQLGIGTIFFVSRPPDYRASVLQQPKGAVLLMKPRP